MSAQAERFLQAVDRQQKDLTQAVMSNPLPYDQYLKLQSQWLGLEVAKELHRQSLLPLKESDDGLQ